MVVFIVAQRPLERPSHRFEKFSGARDYPISHRRGLGWFAWLELQLTFPLCGHEV